jgi:hypothetical protein
MSARGVVVPSFFASLQKSLKVNNGFQFSKYLQIATLTAPSSSSDASNSSSSSSSASSAAVFPSIRTVCFRQFFSDEYHLAGEGGEGKVDVQAIDSLLIHTDARSELYAQLDAQRHAEVCWYFPLSREQYRVSCKVELCSVQEPHDSLSDLRLPYWQGLSNPARLVYSAPLPGTPTSTAADSKEGDLDRYDPQPADVNSPNANFAVVRLMPVRCDYLRLAVAKDNTKPVHRESVLKRPAQHLRSLHVLGNDSQWKVTKLNP